MDKENSIQWQPVVELIVVFAAIIGVTVPLYIQTDYKMEQHRIEARESQVEIRQLVEAIRQDVRDFHGRLCVVEERNRK